MALKQDVYERIKRRFEQLILNGAYLPGEPLPSLRSVALDLGVNPNTVEKAYQELEKEKLIEIIPKKGAYVLPFTLDKKNDLELLKQVIFRLKNTMTEEDITTYIKHYIKGE